MLKRNEKHIQISEYEPLPKTTLSGSKWQFLKNFQILLCKMSQNFTSTDQLDPSL